MVFHEQFWLLLSQRTHRKFIELELLYSVLRILLDPVRITVKAIAQLIDQYLAKFEWKTENQAKYDKKGKFLDFIHFYRDFTVKMWDSEEIVKNFKKLNLNNISYMKTGYLKPKKFEEFQEVFFSFFSLTLFKK